MKRTQQEHEMLPMKLESVQCNWNSQPHTAEQPLTFSTTNRTVSFDIFTTTYSISQDNVISFTFDIGNGIDDREVHSFWGQFIEDTGTFFGEYYTSYFETHDDGVVRYEDEAQGTAILSKQYYNTWVLTVLLQFALKSFQDYL